MECLSAHWDEASTKWKIVVRNTKFQEEKTIWADAFVYAVGRLNNYKIPSIPGQDKFKGRQIHTANWPVDLDVKNKRVVVIGNGASAVQCTAALQPGEPITLKPKAKSENLITLAVVSNIVNIARGPTWIVPHVFSEDGAIQRHCVYSHHFVS